MSDLIDRQAAIDALKDMYHAAEKWGEETSDDVIKARAESCMASLIEMKLRIENLPSAQQEHTETHASDCVSRQAAIDAVDKRFDSVPMEQTTEILMLRKDLRELPSAHPRRGKWARHFDGNEWYWYCSSCKEQWYEEDLWMGGNSFPNFCPNCGADMREGDAE